MSPILMSVKPSLSDTRPTPATQNSAASTLKNPGLGLYMAQARKGVSPEVNALSTLMFVVVLILLLVINFRSSREAKERDKEQL